MRGLSRLRTLVYLAFGAAAAVGVVAAGVALGANQGKEKVALTPAGQAQAKAEVLRQADVGAGWSGGAKKLNLSSNSGYDCPTYKPKQSDLVLIGAAETRWHKDGLTIDSLAQLLKTPAMVQRDWQRTVLAPQVLPCARQAFAKALGSRGRVVSFRRLAFPAVEPYTAEIRGVADITVAAGVSVPMVIDTIAMGAWRNELTLTFSGPASAKDAMRSAEVHLAYRLAGRIRP